MRRRGSSAPPLAATLSLVAIVFTVTLAGLDWTVLSPASQVVPKLSREALERGDKAYITDRRVAVRPGDSLILESDHGARGCTAGIAWQLEGVDHIVTAGHCGDVGDTVYLAGRGIEVGVVVSKPPEDSLLDAELVRLHAGAQADPRIVAEEGTPTDLGPDPTPVIGVAGSGRGDRLCMAGMRTGITCGWVGLGTGFLPLTENGYDTLGGEARRGYGLCPVHGDSGGPVFTTTQEGAYIVGILDATSREAALPILGPCDVVYATVHDISEVLGGTPKLL